ncbi:hypothetical protein F3Y22_tig00110781pilonHSYRG00046 [Hibiscus syriacus]|uniref:Uncharacterized protein n=2 Tax=Hibiscus syriacus TaxID=106335 RepID=A0A6A2ZRI6_HIBSY|nr:hypothetical protein F3Y22_tig00110781pilonHSYRG00046 [Hibiscus syriacus]
MSPVSADDIFYNGQIKPTYPVFDTSLLNNIDQTPNVKPRSRRLPLIELMSEEREPGELDRVTPGTYCVWTPKSETLAKIDTGRYDESDSSGTLSTKRWKLKDLIYTSNRDGQCGSNRDVKAGDMKRSLMPNRKDLVGIFSNINGLSRRLHPF